jgi:hypothetical protein
MKITPDGLFGALAVQEGFASEAEVEVALVAQKENNSGVGGVETRIGQILLEMGALNQAQIEAVLSAQVRYRSAIAPSERLPEPPLKPPQETSSPRLVQQSGERPRINDEAVHEPRLLKPGDTLRVGGSVFVFEGDMRSAPVVVPGVPAASAPEMEIPRDAPPSPPVEGLAPAEPEGGGADPKVRAGILKWLDHGVSRLLPRVHNHRKYLLAAAVAGIVSIVLPWRIAQNGNSVVGFQGPGWLTFVMFCAIAGSAALTWVARPLARPEWITIAVSSGLAVVIASWKIVSTPVWASGRGIGLFLTLFSAIAVHLIVWLIRKSPSEPVKEDTGSEPVAVRVVRGLNRFARNLSGASAKEKAAQLQRRDELLQEIGRMALSAGMDGAEAAPAREALERVAVADQAAKSDIKGRAALKALESKSKRALLKLGRSVLDQKLELADGETKIAEIRALEEKLGKQS